MNTENLTALLHDATDDLEPRPGFADAVLRGSRRRRFRRRLTVATSAATAVALLGGGAYVVVHHDGTEQTTVADSPLLTQPTKGDLAGDQAFLDQAVAEWRVGLTRSPDADRHVYQDMRDEPHVYWAGNTPAGRAAVVAQQVYIHQNGELPINVDGLHMAVGLVAIDPTDNKLKLVTDQWEDGRPESTRLGYFRFGPDDRTVLVTTAGKPVFSSPEPLLRNHKPVRDWRRVPEKDGVAVAELPSGIDLNAAIVVERDTQPDPAYMSYVGSFPLRPASDYLGWVNGTIGFPINSPPPTGIRWMYPQLSAGSTGGPQFDIDKTYQTEVAGKLSFHDGYSGMYYVRAGLPDGRVAVVSDIQNGSHPARFYALLVTPDLKYEVYDGGDVNAAEPLPVHFRLPDQQGWIIAQLNQPLRYRTSTTGAWQDAGTGAALVPDETVQVKVGDTVVNLPR
jgi:hypothetical protein